MGICSSKSKKPQINVPSPQSRTGLILPNDQIVEILSLLKVKSLMRFKCVCKSWNSLISSNPYFSKLHLLKSSRNPYLTQSPTPWIYYLGHSNCSILTFPIFDIESTTIVANDYTIYNLMESHRHRVHVVGSCNGLLCLLQYCLNTRLLTMEYSLRFWNPATRSLSDKLGYFWIWLKNPNLPFEFSFGYDDLTGKYKVVAFRPSEVGVFSLGDNVWRNIQNFPTNPYNCTHYRQNCGVYFRNRLIWFALSHNNVKHSCNNWKDLILTVDQFVIISLDLGTETYTQLLPPQSFDEVPPEMPTVCVLMDCLCFSHYSKGNDFVIWQMREFGVEESWTKLFKFNYGDGHSKYYNLFPLYYFENGDSLILEREGQVVHYNKRGDRVHKIRTTTNAFYWFSGKHYVESLVSSC